MPGDVLVVEDDETLRLAIATGLAWAGFPVREAEDGLAALAAIDQQEPSLLVLDLRMPRMSGVELVEQLRARGQNIPFIIVSADKSAPRVAQDLGAVDCIVKPFRLADLIQTVKVRLEAVA